MGYRVIRDPVYGYVQLPEELDRVVDSPIVQRLRRISQTSLTSAVYPSATGTRFEHALGTMFLAGRAWTAAWNNASESARGAFQRTLSSEVPDLVSERDEEAIGFFDAVRIAVMAVGLLHDLGHPPFSHVLEPVYEEHIEEILGSDVDSALVERLLNRLDQLHEAAGEHLLELYLTRHMDAWLSATVTAIYRSDPAEASSVGALHSIVSGELDVDRLDYLMRDSQRAGTEYGALDWERLVDAYRLRMDGDRPRILPALRARSAAETLLVQRVQAYRWIIYHHQVVGANLALANALGVYLQLVADSPDEGADAVVAEARDRLRACLPSLNYLDPGIESFSRVVGAGDGSTQDRLARLSSILDEREAVSASVDDGTVAQALLRARTIARSLAEDAPPVLGRQLQLMATFVDAALLRRKNYVAIWRSENEFAQSAARIWDEFGVGDAVNAVLDGWFQKAGMDPPFDHKAFMSLSIPARVNLLLGDLVAEPDVRAALAANLNDALVGGSAPGEWRVAPIRFSAVAQGARAGQLWDELGKSFVLAERSQLVRAMTSVDQERPKVGFFYFMTAPGPSHQSELRRTLRVLAIGVVTERVGQFIVDHLREVLPSVEEQ